MIIILEVQSATYAITNSTGANSQISGWASKQRPFMGKSDGVILGSYEPLLVCHARWQSEVRLSVKKPTER
ncbi:MAG: hypothetical protein ACNA8W_13380 [Bradymonadaceae bacterium]